MAGKLSAVTWAVALPLLMTLVTVPGGAAAEDARQEHSASRSSSASAAKEEPVDPSTWVDHDGRPAPKPADREPNLVAHLFREAFTEQISHGLDIPDKILWLLQPLGVHPNREAANVNAWDEVPNSTWFTNRNHVHAVPPQVIRDGPFGAVRPETPWTVIDLKHGGVNAGFQIRDANGKRWVIKLDLPGFPQLSSGADVAVSRLIWAAGFNFSHDEAVTFRRDDLKLQTEVAQAHNDPPVSESELEAVLKRGEREQGGRYYATASLYLPGERIGPIKSRSRRHDDRNDWYTHPNRRELRGLYVLFSWLNYWDVKEQQSLDMFEPPHATSGHVNHFLLDAGASLGASAEGPKNSRRGFEQRLDFGWIGMRLLTLGFIQEPWRRAQQQTGIPSVGNFEGAVFEPPKWRPLQYVEPFRKMTDADAYWGAKLVASFSDAQIRAAIDAAGYEDPRAPAYLFEILRLRRDKVARYWFDQVAPLDFFQVDGEVLRFRDLAVDIGLTAPRSYEVEVVSSDPKAPMQVAHLSRSELSIAGLTPGVSELHAKIKITGSRAEPARVDLARSDSGWVVRRVRHT